MRQWPKIEYKEECMREGMQIEDVHIPVERKLRLLEAISETGLKSIVVGSFVSPKYTPQMACIDELLSRFRPTPGVTYTALVANARGEEQARAYSPPLTLETPSPVGNTPSMTHGWRPTSATTQPSSAAIHGNGRHQAANLRNRRCLSKLCLADT